MYSITHLLNINVQVTGMTYPQQIIECSEDVLRMLYPCYRT